ncbi:MAG: hypothetical protein ABIQ89_02830 [Candidatus Saccharimonadales bacterium]
MHKINFHYPLTTMQIREPMTEACHAIAKHEGIFATLQQTQQAALEGRPGMPKSQRPRIGNGKHKVWEIQYQTDHPSISRPNVVGIIVVRSHIDTANMQYGGFDYGEWDDEILPTYPYITLQTPSERNYWRPNDPSPEIFSASVLAIGAALDDGQLQLFNPGVDDAPPAQYA